MYLFNVYNDMRELNLEFVLAETLRLKKKNLYNTHPDPTTCS